MTCGSAERFGQLKGNVTATLHFFELSHCFRSSAVLHCGNPLRNSKFLSYAHGNGSDISIEEDGIFPLPQGVSALGRKAAIRSALPHWKAFWPKEPARHDLPTRGSWNMIRSRQKPQLP
jgi:hypothetical protein